MPALFQRLDLQQQIQSLGVSAFKFHSLKQEKAFDTDRRILLAGTGTQWGKTTIGAARMVKKIFDSTNPTDNFLITSPTYKHLYQSTLPPFLRMIEPYGKPDKKMDLFKMHHGQTIFFRNSHDPDSIVGITDIKHIWGDEAGKYSLYFWENLQARADSKGASIDLTTSPYSMNWVYKELIKPFNQGKRPDVEYISAASWENPYHSLHDAEKRDFKRSTMDPRRFGMLYGGEFGKMVGLVYQCFDEDLNQCEPFQLPRGTRVYAGIDWGFTEPFAMTVRAVTQDGSHFQVHEFCKSGLTITDIITYAKQIKQVWGIEQFYCGPDQPGYIEEFNRNGLPAVAADNDIRRGVDLHYELMATRKFKIFRGSSPHTLDELETYHYPDPEDLSPDEDSKEQNPVGQNDHCLDSIRYCTISTYRAALKLVAKAPEEIKQPETLDKFFKSLMKKPRYSD